MNISSNLSVPNGVVGSRGNPREGKEIGRLSAPESVRYFSLLCFEILPSTLSFVNLNVILFLASFIFIFLGFLLGFLSPHSSQLHNIPLYPA